MNFEKRDMVPKNDLEIQDFMEAFNNAHAKVSAMLKADKAHFRYERDEHGKLKFYKIVDDKGELLYYENLQIPGQSSSQPKQEL